MLVAAKGKTLAPFYTKKNLSESGEENEMKQRLCLISRHYGGDHTEMHRRLLQKCDVTD